MPKVPTHARNRPSLIAYDLRSHVPAKLVYDSLYKRGVLKLFYLREQAWRLLDMWLRIGKEAGLEAKRHSADYWHGYRQATLDARADLKRYLERAKDDCEVTDPIIMAHMVNEGFDESH